MNTSPAIQSDCELCAPAVTSSAPGSRCSACVTNGDMIATVAWKIIEGAVVEAADGKRVLFMLTGLSARALEGIVRQAPSAVEGRSLLLRLNPKAAPRLSVSKEFLSEESAVHWRHSDEANVIVFAPPDEEREGIGAGLGPISRIDEQRVIDEIDCWLELLDEKDEAKSYLRAALEGLKASRVYLDLRMWAEFISALKVQGFSAPVDERIKRAIPALRIPKEGIGKLPTFKKVGGYKAKDFAAAFVDAKAEVGVYADLMTPKNEFVNVARVRERVDSYEHGDSPEIIESLNAVRALLDNETNLLSGVWHQSQRDFCEKVSWDRLGAELFGGGRSKAKEGIGLQTLRFIQGNFGEDVTPEDRELLESMKDTAPRDPKDVEVEFFNRWQERLTHPPGIKLFKSWQKRLFSKEVVGHDLISAFAEGFEALIIAGAELLPEMEKPRILVRTTHHKKAYFWEAMDRAVQELFRFELQSLRGVFGEDVVWDLDSAFAHSASGDATAVDSRKIDLELYLVEQELISDLAGLKAPPVDAPRVKTTWQPGRSPKNEPISLSLPDDLGALGNAASSGDSLFRNLVFAPRATGDDTRIASTTLSDRNSFSDVTQNQNGRTFDFAVRPRDNLIDLISSKLDEIEVAGTVSATTITAAKEALKSFQDNYRATVLALAKDPEAAFASTLILEQATAFGTLCEKCRLPANAGRQGYELRELVSKIGVVESDGADRMAILTAWHPLRLSERRSKIGDLSSFVSSVLRSPAAQNADLTVAFYERRAAQGRWVFPEVVYSNDTTMISVEDVGGYSLMIPADSVSRSQEALEASAPSAASKFMEGVDQYLEVHPHEATNLSAAIFDSESQTLPSEVAREMSKRLYRRPELRCDLVITHSDQNKLRKIYSSQNTRLTAGAISESARGFLSRLRVDVRSNDSSEAAGESARDMDLVILHDVISHHAKPTWVEESGRTEDLSHDFDTSIARLPRRRITEADTAGVGIYLTLPRPPRSVAAYHDLLYEVAKQAFLPDHHHGVLIRQVEFAEQKVQQLIKRAHDLGEWVITYDKVSSRTLLQRCGVRIISDISVPGSEGRVIISAGELDKHLKDNVKNDLVKACGLVPEDAQQYAESVLDSVLGISGNKILSAARYDNASREMIGLAVMRSYLEAAVAGSFDTAPIWISLDDYRGWFMSQNGPVADAVGVIIEDQSDGFLVAFQVGEAKFVEKSSESETLKKARQQVRETVDVLQKRFIDNEDEISRAAYCSRLADILVNRDGLASRLPDSGRRASFFDDLSAGRVRFQISGEAVICLHDKHGSAVSSDRDPDRGYLRHHVLETSAIKQALQVALDGSQLQNEIVQDVVWYTGRLAETAPDNTDEFSTEPEETTQELSLVPSGHENIETQSEKNNTEAENREHAPEQPELPILPNVEKTEAIAVAKAPGFIPEPLSSILIDMVDRESGSIDDAASMAWAEQISKETQRALSHFNMQAEFSEPKLRLTPNGALISFRGHHTLTVDKIEKRTGELLTTYGIDVADVRPGRGRISLFVTREKRATVPLASTWLGASWPDRDPGVMTSFILGAREDENSLLHLNLSGSFAGYDEHGPHTLIAGGTGSGKGILTQSLLLQLITFNDPREAELVLVDPKKGVDFKWLEGAPQMRSGIITEMCDAEIVLGELVVEMDRRYDKLASVGAENISQYNEMVSSEKRMSRIFLVHDELGAWMAQDKNYQEVVLSAVANLGMKARAAGIHLFLITQRADADAVPGRLRDNMGNRLCLKVQNSTGSRMVLGVVGAEKLLGKGHMACVLANQAAPPGQDFFVVQVPFADREDIKSLAQAAKAYWTYRSS